MAIVSGRRRDFYAIFLIFFWVKQACSRKAREVLVKCVCPTLEFFLKLLLLNLLSKQQLQELIRLKGIKSSNLSIYFCKELVSQQFIHLCLAQLGIYWNLPSSSSFYCLVNPLLLLVNIVLNDVLKEIHVLLLHWLLDLVHVLLRGNLPWRLPVHEYWSELKLSNWFVLRLLLYLANKLYLLFLGEIVEVDVLSGRCLAQLNHYIFI